MTWITGLMADYWLWIAVAAVALAAVFNPVAVWKAKAWILVAIVGWWGFTGHQAHDALQVQYAEQQTALEAARADASEAARETEQALAAGANAAAEAYERGKQDAEQAAADVVAGLRAGSLRLRRMWEGCQATSHLSGTAPGPGEPDAGADDRAASAGRIVRAAATCDAQVRGLQELVRSDRGQHAVRAGD